MEQMDNKQCKAGRKILKALLWCVGIWLAILIILEITLSQSVLTGIVNKYASRYIDADLKFGKVSLSMFRHFPNVSLTLEECSVTYPSDRFDEEEKMGVQGHLMYHGCGEEADTLASFRRFSAALNLPSLVTGTIHIPYLSLERPRIFAHSYADGSANWNIFKTEPSEEAADTLEENGGMPDMVLGRIKMTDRPHIVFTDSKDTLFAMARIRSLTFNGKLDTRKADGIKVGLSLDSMSVAGRMGRDTLVFGLEKFHLHQHENHIDVDMAAKAGVATRSFGRMMVPFDVNGIVSFPEDSVLAVKAEDFKIDIAYIPVKAEADLRFMKEAVSVKAQMEINECDVNELIKKYAVNFIPSLKGFSTDAKVSMLATCEGTTGKEGIDVGIKRLDISSEGLYLNAEGQLEDVLGKDPLLDIDGGLFANIDSLVTFLPDSLGIEATGALEAHVLGKARLSQLNLYNFSSSSLTGEILGEMINISIPKDSVKVEIDGLKIVAGPQKKTFGKKQDKTMTLMGISGDIGKADITYRNQLNLTTSGLRISAMNIMDETVPADTVKKIHPFGGVISAGKLNLKDFTGSAISLDSTWNGFRLFPKRGQSNVPVLAFDSRNQRIRVKAGVNRGMIIDGNISAHATLNTFERRQKMRAFRDSLSRLYPDVPKDSLMAHMMAQKGPRPELPEWMKEEDFRKQDIDIRLDRTLAKYFRDWDLKGKIDVRSGMVMTPYFPLRNSLKDFELDFTNDKVEISSLDLICGSSSISATGKVSGLKRALLGRRGMLKLDLDVKSNRTDVDQFLKAYAKGSSFKPEEFKVSENISDAEFLDQVLTDTTAVYQQPSLIVVPANLIADISIDASGIKYSELMMKKVSANLKMKERCVQITDTKAVTNMGNISFEGFYSTRSKSDLTTGFCLEFEDITAEKVISLMPAIDTIMPLLKSFEGKLDCELAATAQLDTNMNLKMPSINGVMRIGGEDLVIRENEMFRKLAKTLIFKNRKEGRIDKMIVEGVVKDSRLEVFPFILDVDRYTLGLSGVQNMDMSFRYHASLIKSPFLIKVGMDIYGDDFDSMKLKIGKAKYKNRNVPVFSSVIDETKINLVESIKNVFYKGVEAVVKENVRQDVIEEHKKNIGYVQAVDMKMEELSEEEQKKLEEEQQTEYEQSGIHRDNGEDNAVQ